jgi:hypothetical protein
MSGFDDFSLPHFTCTEDAVRFGQSMTRDQFILLTGARAALKNRFYAETDQQRRLFIAIDIQLYREALEAAPVAFSLLTSHISPVSAPCS